MSVPTAYERIRDAEWTNTMRPLAKRRSSLLGCALVALVVACAGVEEPSPPDPIYCDSSTRRVKRPPSACMATPGSQDYVDALHSKFMQALYRRDSALLSESSSVVVHFGPDGAVVHACVSDWSNLKAKRRARTAARSLKKVAVPKGIGCLQGFGWTYTDIPINPNKFPLHRIEP